MSFFQLFFYFCLFFFKERNCLRFRKAFLERAWKTRQIDTLLTNRTMFENEKKKFPRTILRFKQKKKFRNGVFNRKCLFFKFYFEFNRWSTRIGAILWAERFLSPMVDSLKCQKKFGFTSGFSCEGSLSIEEMWEILRKSNLVLFSNLELIKR